MAPTINLGFNDGPDPARDEARPEKTFSGLAFS